MKYKVKRVFIEQLEEDLSAEDALGYRLVCYDYIQRSSQELLVTYATGDTPDVDLNKWQCGCGTVNIAPFTTCSQCKRRHPRYLGPEGRTSGG